MSILTPITKEDIEAIRKQYFDIIRNDILRINDPNNLSIVPKIVSEIQEKLNDCARHVYDKFGRRIIIRVGPDKFDYLDITSPRIQISQTKALIVFLETDEKGKPARNPTEL